MKILKISFRNAKLFSYASNNKDYVSDLIIRKKRNEQLMFKEPITVFQVSNMLHKMFGERPVPSFRNVCYKKNDEVFELAQNSYLKINTLKIYNKYKKREEFISELMQVKKHAGNSWTKTPIIFWAKIKKYFGDDFNEFIERFNKIIGENVLNKPFMSYAEYFKNKVLNNEQNEFLHWIKKLKKTPIYNFLLIDKRKINDIVKHGNISETVKTGISNTIILNGLIYVPIENDDLVKNIVYNTVTILDGGVATIEQVLYPEQINSYDFDDFVKVNEISINKQHKVIY